MVWESTRSWSLYLCSVVFNRYKCFPVIVVRCICYFDNLHSFFSMMNQQYIAYFILIVGIFSTGKCQFISIVWYVLILLTFSTFSIYLGSFPYPCCHFEMQSWFWKHRKVVFFNSSWEQIFVQVSWDLREDWRQHGSTWWTYETKFAAEIYSR